MSLGTWFRDYVYIPLGGNRVSKPRQFFNILVVWLLTGFWHGAEWNFPVWGLYFAVLLLIEKSFLLKKLNKSKVISHVYVMFLVIISFVIFNAADMSVAFSDLAGMFGLAGVPVSSAEFVYYLRSYLLVIVIAIVGATPLPKRIVEKIREKETGNKVINLIEPAVCIILFVMITAYLVDGSFNPFLYFRF